MSCSTKRICTAVLGGLLFLLSASVSSWGVNGEPIGSISAIEGEVYLSHKGDTAAFQAMFGDPIYLFDHIQTERQSRVQILFHDESLLNLAENTYIQITEHIYSPEENRRSSIFRILTGKVRAIVGRYFPGAGSRYKVSTPTAIIGVRGTHFVVDATLTEETTVVCIDTELDLAVKNIQEEVVGQVILTSGFMTKVLEGQPPTSPEQAPEDLIMQLLMDTRVTMPTFQSGPGGLLGKAGTAKEAGLTDWGEMPPIPIAPDEPLFDPVFPYREEPPLPPPPPPPPQN